MKRFLIFLLCFTIMIGLVRTSAYAASDWPADISINAGGGIVIDADSGTVIYGHNMHNPFYPASITKILTALVVLEECDLDEIVTYSHNAVYNVEENSSSANLEEGDQLTVRDSLYALLLKSANEAANALAEHTAGSIEEFAGLMNAKARQLGCQDSNFHNPSGLNDDSHYTSPYDMAIISRAAFQNKTFVEIDSTLAYHLPPTIRNPEGHDIYPGHRMMKKSQDVYYPGIIGGKTGYTIRAGNTLVTCVKQGDMTLIAVILDGYQTHYADTKKLLDFGFNNFKSLRIADYETAYTDIDNDLTFAGLPAANLSVLSFSKDSRILLPSDTDFSEAQSSISFDITSADPEGAVARINYNYNDRDVGSAYLMHTDPTPTAHSTLLTAAEQNAGDGNVPITKQKQTDGNTAGSESGTAKGPSRTASNGGPDADRDSLSSDPPTGDIPAAIDTAPFEIPPLFFMIAGALLAGIALITALVMWRINVSKREAVTRYQMQVKRQQRLKELGISTNDFEKLVQQKRSRTDQLSKR